MTTEKLIAIFQQIRGLVDNAIEDLAGTGRKIERPNVHQKKQAVNTTRLSFDMNLLAFMSKYARGRSGHQKFTLLLARLAKGSVAQQVPSAELKKQWNKMTAVLGGKYNHAYANRAKAGGWVDTPKHGVFTLSNSWKEALTENND